MPRGAAAANPGALGGAVIAAEGPAALCLRPLQTDTNMQRSTQAGGHGIVDGADLIFAMYSIQRAEHLAWLKSILQLLFQL